MPHGLRNAAPPCETFIGNDGLRSLDISYGGWQRDFRKGRIMHRRQPLGLIAVTAGGGTFMSASAFAQNSAQPASAALLMPEAGVCAIMRETTEGPFYVDPELERRDISEGRAGCAAFGPVAGRRPAVPASCRQTGRHLALRCARDLLGLPRAGRHVDTSGQKFLRSIQHTDDSGIVAFATIYPGWYRGRTTHIHFKVFLDQSSALTGQTFFPGRSQRAASPHRGALPTSVRASAIR